MKTILVPTNFSVYATDALVTAASIVRANGGKLILMHNVETLLTNWPRMSENERLKHVGVWNHSDSALREINEIMLSGILYSLSVDPMITYGVTSDEILRTAVKTNAELIVMASGDNKSGRDFIGSTLQRVVREAPCPVLSIKKEIGSAKWTKILIPVSLDFDIHAPFETIAKISNELGLLIQLLYVNTPQNFKNSTSVKKRMDDFKGKYPELSIETAVIDHTEVEEGILEFSKSSRADCIAMVTFEHRHAPGYQLSVTDHILYHATVPVLAIYEGARMIQDRMAQTMQSL